ncbi:GAF and ANTAR domain-containing protein [Streptomyces sp. ODS28]|uniref:GAF and ANTAR domain-containing protein n=1 Tax=Streptomyces sp. ODS28 TaxID=3136688 RepID=UPI0031EEC987
MSSPSPQTRAGSPELRTASGELAEALLFAESVEEALQHVAETGARTVGDGVLCSVTLRREGRLTTAGSSARLAELLDETQYGLKDGPCVQAMDERTAVYAEDLEHEGRWDEYPAAAREFGVAAVYSHPLAVEVDSVGALNFYAFRTDVLDAERRRVCDGLAENASLLLQATMRNVDRAALADQIHDALRHRSYIDQAVGIVMARQRVDAEAAFAVLRRNSQQRNVKLRTVALRIIESATGRPAKPLGAFRKPGDPPADA